MDLKKELPKLGKDVPDGVDFGIDKKTMVYSLRPDYAEFKKKKYNKEVRCVAVLVGFLAPNTVHKICLERWWEFMNGPHHGLDQIGNPRFSFLGSAVGIFSDIREIIDIGIATNEIGRVLENDPKLLKEEFESDTMFSRNRWFDTLPFLNWMRQNGYPIPDELAFDAGVDGELYWINDKSNTSDYSVLPDEEKASLAREWKQPGPRHLTNKEINNRLYPDMKNDSATKKINRMVEKFRK